MTFTSRSDVVTAVVVVAAVVTADTVVFPVMIYSDQLILLREFQKRFDTLWARAESVIANRASVISILQDVAERLQLY